MRENVFIRACCSEEGLRLCLDNNSNTGIQVGKGQVELVTNLYQFPWDSTASSAAPTTQTYNSQFRGKFRKYGFREFNHIRCNSTGS